MKLSHISEICIGKISSWTGGKTQGICTWDFSGDPVFYNLIYGQKQAANLGEMCYWSGWH